MRNRKSAGGRVGDSEPWVRYAPLAFWLAANLLLAWFAFRPGAGAARAVVAEWTERVYRLTLAERLPIAAPFITLASTVLTHWLDWKKNGSGISQRVREIGVRRFALDPAVLSATITKQSVLAAIASILIVVVQNADGAARQPGRFPSDFHHVVTWLTTIGFLLAILLILVSVKTYDYASRFNWGAHPGGAGVRYQAKLVDKALDLDILSYYFLFFSFTLSTALINPWLPVPVSLLGGMLLWWSYFFPPRWDRGGVSSPAGDDEFGEVTSPP